MLRRVLALSIALALLSGGHAASATRSTIPLAGDVRAMTFAGEDLVVARQPPRGGLAVARLVAGSAPQPLLDTSLRDPAHQVQLAGSGQALAVGVQPDSGATFASSRVFVGPPSGPLREVASCPAGLLAPPVAVIGARIAWRDGGCGDPPASPTGITPAAIMIGAADPAIAPVRVMLDPAVLPVSLVLAGGGGMVGTLRPSFFAPDGEVRSFSPLGIGTTLVSERSAVVAPVGMLADATRVFSLAELNGDESNGRDDVCPNALFTIAAGATERRELALGGCLVGADAPSGPRAAHVADDRVHALVSDTRRSEAQPPLISLVSARGDGGDRRVHAVGSYRPPLGFAADGARIAYWHSRCTDDGSDLVVAERADGDGRAEIASCRARVLTRVARVRDGRIAVRMRCPIGCRGVAIDARDPQRRLRTFSLGPGTHVLRLTLSRATRRRGRLRLEIAIAGGPGRLAEIRLRR